MNAPTVSCINFPMSMDTAMLHTLDLNLCTQPLQLPLDLVNIQLLGPVVLAVKWKLVISQTILFAGGMDLMRSFTWPILVFG